MENQTNLNQLSTPAGGWSKSWVRLIMAIVIIIALITGGVYFGFWKKNKSNSINLSNLTDTTKSMATTSNGKKVEILDKVLKNKFGWLSANPDDASMIDENGGDWVRPHPGGFRSVYK